MRADLGGLPPPFVGAYEHLSRQLKRYVIDLSRMRTILDVAELTGLCGDTVKGIIKERLAKDYAHIRLKDLRRLAIDEIYLGRKQKYLTLVIDQETGRIVWVGRGRAGEALHGFWRRLKASGAKIEAVAMDMSQSLEALLLLTPQLDILQPHSPSQNVVGQVQDMVALVRG